MPVFLCLVSESAPPLFSAAFLNQLGCAICGMPAQSGTPAFGTVAKASRFFVAVIKHLRRLSAVFFLSGQYLAEN